MLKGNPPPPPLHIANTLKEGNVIQTTDRDIPTSLSKFQTRDNTDPSSLQPDASKPDASKPEASFSEKFQPRDPGLQLL
jgi:hypothetical protein